MFGQHGLAHKLMADFNVVENLFFEENKYSTAEGNDQPARKKRGGWVAVGSEMNSGVNLYLAHAIKSMGSLQCSKSPRDPAQFNHLTHRCLEFAHVNPRTKAQALTPSDADPKWYKGIIGMGKWLPTNYFIQELLTETVLLCHACHVFHDNPLTPASRTPIMDRVNSIKAEKGCEYGELERDFGVQWNVERAKECIFNDGTLGFPDILLHFREANPEATDEQALQCCFEMDHIDSTKKVDCLGKLHG